MMDVNLKKIIEEQIGNNDPYWNEPVFHIVKKIIELPEGAEVSIEQLLNDKELSYSKFIFEITKIVVSVCQKLNIILEPTNSVSFIKKVNSINTIPENLKEFIYLEDGYIFSKQKLPRELEKDYNDFLIDFYSKNNKNVNNIIDKIKKLPLDFETTIAQLIDYNPQINIVDPLTQNIIFNVVEEQCKKENIKLMKTEDSIGGLAYNYKFKKIKMQ